MCRWICHQGTSNQEYVNAAGVPRLASRFGILRDPDDSIRSLNLDFYVKIQIFINVYVATILQPAGKFRSHDRLRCNRIHVIMKQTKYCRQARVSNLKMPKPDSHASACTEGPRYGPQTRSGPCPQTRPVAPGHGHVVFQRRSNVSFGPQLTFDAVDTKIWHDPMPSTNIVFLWHHC